MIPKKTPEQVQFNYHFDTPTTYEVFFDGGFVGTIDGTVDGSFSVYFSNGRYVGFANDLASACNILCALDEVVFVGYEKHDDEAI